MLLSGNGHPWEAWERPEGGHSGGLYALPLRGFSGSSSLPPPDGASSSVGFHHSSCGFPSFSHPLKNLSLVSACVSSGHLPLLPSPCLPSRQGTGGRISWERLGGGSFCPSRWGGEKEGCLLPPRLPCPRSNGQASGEISHRTSWLLPACGSRRGPSPWPAVSQVGEAWRPGQAGACLLSSLHTGPLPPAPPSAGPWQVPHSNGRFLCSQAPWRLEVA